jgi:hypothetical protein
MDRDLLGMPLRIRSPVMVSVLTTTLASKLFLLVSGFVCCNNVFLYTLLRKGLSGVIPWITFFSMLRNEQTITFCEKG